MSITRVLLCVILPPLAVYDRGILNILVTLLLTLVGWVPGVIFALLVLNNKVRL